MTHIILSLSEWLLSLNVIHLVSFIFLHGLLAHSFLSAGQYSIVWEDHSLLFYSPTEGCLGCFQVFANVTTAAVNTHVQVFV